MPATGAPATRTTKVCAVTEEASIGSSKRTTISADGATFAAKGSGALDSTRGALASSTRSPSASSSPFVASVIVRAATPPLAGSRTDSA